MFYTFMIFLALIPDDRQYNPSNWLESCSGPINNNNNNQFLSVMIRGGETQANERTYFLFWTEYFERICILDFYLKFR